MALTLGDNFSYQGAKPLDARLKYDTVAAMKAVADATMYDGCLAYCTGTGKTYQWKSTNTVDETTGKWREFTSGGGGGGSYTAGDGIIIDNDEISTDNMQEEDMAEVITASPSGNRFIVTGFTPVGTIISVMGTVAPLHYLACDGSEYNISDYIELAKHIKRNFGSFDYFGGDGTATFAVPDLRGEFLRGTGANGHENQGNGGDVGVHQDGTWNPTPRTFTTSSGAADSGQAYVISFPSTLTSDAGIPYGQSSSATQAYLLSRNADKLIANNPSNIRYNVAMSGSRSQNTNVTWDVGYTTRPTNTSVLYCIATKDIYLDAESYSEDEKVVGSWIGGETLYQKTLTITCPTVTSGGGSPVYGSTLLGVKTADMGRIVKIEGSMQNDGLTVPVPFINPQGYVVGNAGNDNGDIRVYITTNHTAMSNQDVLLTVQYTKATS